MKKVRKKLNLANQFSKRLKEHEKTPEWWIEGVDFFLGEALAQLEMLRKVLRQKEKQPPKE